MHVMKVDTKWVCGLKQFRRISTKAHMDKRNRTYLVEKYTQLIQSNAPIDVEPIRVVQTQKGYLHVVHQTEMVGMLTVAYVIASHKLRRQIRVISRKQVRPLGTARSVANERCSRSDGRPLSTD